MQLEAAYVAALGEVRSFEVIGEGDGLLLTGGQTPLSYVAERQTPLEGTAWVIDGIAIGDDAVSSTIAWVGGRALVRRRPGVGQHRLQPVDGLLRHVDATEGSISFAPIATTKRLCEPDVAAQEQAILAALDAAASYSIEGSTMTLSDAAGSFLLSLAGR